MQRAYAIPSSAPISFLCMYVLYVPLRRIDSSLGDANFVHPIAVLVSQQTALVGWTYEVGALCGSARHSGPVTLRP